MRITLILFWNCQGITLRRFELIDFIHQQKIYILLLTETHHTDQRSINIPNYFTYTSNHPQIPGHSAGGGTAIHVHKRYTHQHVAIPTTSLENTTVTLSYASHIWASNLSASSWSKLERLQSTSLRQTSSQQ